jgi:hypothetical protein
MFPASDIFTVWPAFGPPDVVVVAVRLTLPTVVRKPQVLAVAVGADRHTMCFRKRDFHGSYKLPTGGQFQYGRTRRVEGQQCPRFGEGHAVVRPSAGRFFRVRDICKIFLPFKREFTASNLHVRCHHLPVSPPAEWQVDGQFTTPCTIAFMLIPASQESITPAALNRLFKHAKADLPEVASFEVTALDGGNGYLAQSYRLDLRWRNSDGPRSLVAKLPLQARLDAMTPDAVRMYRREAMFHRVVAKNVEIPTAHAYVSEIDAESSAAVMVFEDLGALETFSDDESVSVERVQRSLEHLASLHARYWNSAELEGLDWLAHPAKTAVDQVDAERFAIFWPRMVASAAYPLSKTQQRIGELLCAKMDGLYEQLHAGPFSLIHTDMHQENIFFDGREPVFIDWQLVERANPAKDVAKLTASCLEPGTIQHEQPALLRAYQEALTQSDITGYSMDALRRDVHLATCHYMAITLFLDDSDFAARAANIEGRTDFTTSRILAACDREEILAAVESL